MNSKRYDSVDFENTVTSNATSSLEIFTVDLIVSTLLFESTCGTRMLNQCTIARLEIPVRVIGHELHTLLNKL